MAGVVPGVVEVYVLLPEVVTGSWEESEVPGVVTVVPGGYVGEDSICEVSDEVP